jgi:hypothetical protein
VKEQGVPDSLWLLGQARGTAIVLRLAIALGGAVVIAATWAAAGNGTVPWLAAATVALLVVCVVNPDGAGGTGFVVAAGVHWVFAVDDVTTAWAMVAAAGLAITHIAAAAAGVAPAGARWTPAMRRRWGRRAAIVVPSGVVTWILVAAADGREIGGNGPLVGVALLALAGAVLWARRISLD